MVRRKDVDYIFWKNTPNTTTGTNDAMYFYSEGASYFDSSIFLPVTGYPYVEFEKNSVSLVGYRVNNLPASDYPSGSNPDYNQLERLAKALSWDGGAYNASQPTQNSVQPNMEVLLTYPPTGNDPVNGPSYMDPTVIGYSTAYFNSTLAGAYSNNSSDNYGDLNGGGNSAVGTYPGGSPLTTVFNDSTDTSYRSVGSQVFRFEYSFQLKDGTMSDKPMMVHSASISNGVPSSIITGGANGQRPLPTDDSGNNAGDGTFAIGSRWWDPNNHIGYICLDATPNYAVWHEIGIQDVAAIIVTIAVIDKQGLTYIKARGGDLKNIAAKLPDYSMTATPTAAGTVAGDPAYLLDPNKSTNPVSWTYALLPGKGVSTVTGTSKLPQAMISQIRVYQRYFYLNTY